MGKSVPGRLAASIQLRSCGSCDSLIWGMAGRDHLTYEPAPRNISKEVDRPREKTTHQFPISNLQLPRSSESGVSICELGLGSWGWELGLGSCELGVW